MTDSQKRNNIISSIIFFIILLGTSTVFMSFFAYCTSPLSNVNDGYDAAFFRLVGQGMTKGYLPYRDFYDMKGPYLFLIQYVGQMISYGRKGIFAIQSLNLSLALFIISKIFEYFNIKKIAQFLLLMPILLVCTFTFEGANLTEEFSLIPVLVCLYIGLIFFDKCETQSDFWQKKIYLIAGSIFGICFGYLVMVRITNAAFICAIVLVIIIYLIVKKKFVKLAVCAGSFIAGLIVSLIPAVLFFYSKGLLKEMLEAVFVLGVKYSGEKTVVQHLIDIAKGPNKQLIFLLAIPGIIPAVIGWKSWKERSLAVIGAAMIFFAIASGNNYVHYYNLAIPLIVMCEIPVALELKKTAINRRSVAAIVLAVLMITCQYPLIKYYTVVSKQFIIQKNFNNTREIIRDISDKIPEEDKDSVYAYNIDPYWYTYADLFPCIKYCGWHEHYIKLIPEISDDLEQIFNENPPAWLVLPCDHGYMPDFMEEKLGTEYELSYQNERYHLYHHIG